MPFAPASRWIGRASTGSFGAALSMLLVMGPGCSQEGDSKSTRPQVVVYCSVDESYSSPILKYFEEQTGIRVLAVYDSEAGKTTGLVQRLIAEARSGRPGADVFWSGELFGTMQLALLGVLEPYTTPAAEDIPSRFKDSNLHWTANAVRPRVIAYPKGLDRNSLPETWHDLSKPEFVRYAAMANPLFGTTRGHVAAMFALWGPERATDYLNALRSGGALILDGNSVTVRAVMDGRARFAATDSDDVWAANRSGATLESKALDMGDGGALLIPCSVALVKDARNDDPARKLIDFLVSAQTERMLAQSPSRNIPVRPALRLELGLDWPDETKVTFQQIFEAIPQADAAVREILIR